MWQPSPRIITQSHDLVVGGAPAPSLQLVEARNEVMFNQQTKGSVAMTHRSPKQVHHSCTVIFPRLQRAKYWNGVIYDQRG